MAAAATRATPSHHQRDPAGARGLDDGRVEAEAGAAAGCSSPLRDVASTGAVWCRPVQVVQATQRRPVRAVPRSASSTLATDAGVVRQTR